MERKVRVRFAPSPTGPLHIGGVRTALYNYLFARSPRHEPQLRHSESLPDGSPRPAQPAGCQNQVTRTADEARC